MRSLASLRKSGNLRLLTRSRSSGIALFSYLKSFLCGLAAATAALFPAILVFPIVLPTLSLFQSALAFLAVGTLIGPPIFLRLRQHLSGPSWRQGLTFGFALFVVFVSCVYQAVLAGLIQLHPIFRFAFASLVACAIYGVVLTKLCEWTAAVEPQAIRTLLRPIVAWPARIFRRYFPYRRSRLRSAVSEKSKILKPDLTCLGQKEVWLETAFVFISLLILFVVPFRTAWFVSTFLETAEWNSSFAVVLTGFAAALLVIVSRNQHGLTLGECCLIGVTYAVGGLIATALSPLPRLATFDSYETSYIIDVEFRFFFGCAGVALLLGYLGKTDHRIIVKGFGIVFAAMIVRYAVYKYPIQALVSESVGQTAIGYLKFYFMMMPAALTGVLWVTAAYSKMIDRLSIMAVWLVCIAVVHLDSTFPLFFKPMEWLANSIIFGFLFVFVIVPTTLTWPVLAVVRPQLVAACRSKSAASAGIETQAIRTALQSIFVWPTRFFYRYFSRRRSRRRTAVSEITGRKRRADAEEEAGRKLATARPAVFLLAGLAVISALLSDYAPFDAWGLLTVSLITGQPLLPAFYLGLVLCVGIFFWESKRKKDLVIVFGSVLVAWVCAFQAAYQLHSMLGTQRLALLISGLVGGLIGSLATAAGITLVSKDARTCRFFTRTVFVGTAAGLLLEFEPVRLPLYLVWQPAVAASVAYGIVQPKLSKPRGIGVYFPARKALSVLIIGVMVVGAIGLFFHQQMNELIRRGALLADTPLTEEQERALKSKDVFRECEGCPEMTVVPAGSFRMGSPPTERGRSNSEGPRHTVDLPRPFAIGKFAVTFDEWAACVKDGGCNRYEPFDRGWGKDQRPVINVSWDDAQAYVTWLSSKTGKLYRLPSEAEREYATRAGTETPFSFGSGISPEQANYDGTQAYDLGPRGQFRRQTVPVDSFSPNSWDLYQMHGNVWEWTQDCWNPNYDGAPNYGAAWSGGNCSLRVLRGGSWSSHPTNLRSADRFSFATNFRGERVGLRVVRTLAP